MATPQEVFCDEARELVEELTAVLLELEDTPDDLELVGRAFRALHTIKGSGAMFGFDELAGFVHDIETAFDHVRNGSVHVTRKLIDITLASSDLIRAMIEPGGGVDRETKDTLTAAFLEIVPPDTPEPCNGGVSANAEEALPKEKHKTVTYRIRFAPARDIFLTGTNPILLLNELRELGHCSVAAQTEDVPHPDRLDPEQCYLSWDIVLTTDCGVEAIKDVFIFVEDSCDLRIETVGETDGGPADAAGMRLGEILVDRGDITPEILARALDQQKRIGEVLVERGAVRQESVESALVEQEHVKTVSARRRSEESASSIRVAADKVDTLVDLAGEMVTLQARLSQTAAAVNHTELSLIAEDFERLTAELRDNTMSIRMLPIGTTFGRFKRVVRDLAGELGKQVQLETRGGDTELDKTVIERLTDPLMHLIRNSIDHGIEQPEAREAAGKPRTGTVCLSAGHSGAYVVIQIADDGAGLDRKAIIEKAAEKGLVSREDELTDREVYELIFSPGFSTSGRVTGISGRGVGMDVVRQNISCLRGTIDISSLPGRGTTITLQIPLTLAIIDGLLVKIRNGFYVLPLSVVRECVELTAAGRQKMHGKHLADVRGELVPYIYLREQFGISGTGPAIEQIVVCEIEGRNVGFVVDHVVGGHQTVIKNLGNMYRDIEGLSGATILGDGTVALILDPLRLAQSAAPEESAPGAGAEGARSCTLAGEVIV